MEYTSSSFHLSPMGLNFGDFVQPLLDYVDMLLKFKDSDFQTGNQGLNNIQKNFKTALDTIYSSFPSFQIIEQELCGTKPIRKHIMKKYNKTSSINISYVSYLILINFIIMSFTTSQIKKRKLIDLCSQLLNALKDDTSEISSNAIEEDNDEKDLSKTESSEDEAPNINSSAPYQHLLIKPKNKPPGNSNVKPSSGSTSVNRPFSYIPPEPSTLRYSSTPKSYAKVTADSPEQSPIPGYPINVNKETTSSFDNTFSKHSSGPNLSSPVADNQTKNFSEADPSTGHILSTDSSSPVADNQTKNSSGANDNTYDVEKTYHDLMQKLNQLKQQDSDT